jgi:hypothetical protein
MNEITEKETHMNALKPRISVLGTGRMGSAELDMALERLTAHAG